MLTQAIATLMLLAERLSTPECSVVCYIFAVGQSVIIWLEASISNLPANNDGGLASNRGLE